MKDFYLLDLLDELDMDLLDFGKDLKDFKEVYIAKYYKQFTFECMRMSTSFDGWAFIDKKWNEERIVYLQDLDYMYKQAQEWKSCNPEQMEYLLRENLYIRDCLRYCDNFVHRFYFELGLSNAEEANS